MISYCFPKAFRLLTKRDYRLLKGGSQRFVGRYLCIDFRASLSGISRLGITASGRYGDSYQRNRFKRLAREAFRTARPNAPSCEVHVIPRQAAKSASFDDIAGDFDYFFKSSFSH